MLMKNPFVLIQLVLLLGAIASGCGEDQPSFGPFQELPQPIAHEMEAISFKLDTAEFQHPHWALWRNCALAKTLSIEPGVTAVAFLAKGSPCQGTWPLVDLRWNGHRIGGVAVTSSDWAWYVVPASFEERNGELRLAFVNDRLTRNEDINLFIRKVVLLRAQT